MLMMRRSATMIVAAAALLAVGLWVLLTRPWDSATVTAGGPVIFISIDTLRADRLPAYGSTRTKTPQIDRLAADGVLFENAYAHSPQTLPSHTSILSGELPFTHGVRDNIGFSVKSGQRLLQHELKAAGYTTGAFVSSYVLREQTGFSAGFDHFDDDLPPASPEEPLGQVQRRGEDTIAAAIRWVDAQPGQFFLFAHIYEPHTPYTPPARFTNPDKYDGEVEYSDEIVGRLLDHLRAKGLYDAATIVLFSDHGEGLGDHGEEEHGIFLYRETIHVPLIIKLPGSRGAGRRVAEPVQHVDLAPTVLALLGRPAQTAVAGRLKPAPTSDQDAVVEAVVAVAGRLKPAPTSDQDAVVEAVVEAGFSRPTEDDTSRPLAGRSLLPILNGTGDLPPANIYSESLSPRYHFGWSELYALSDDRYRFIRAPQDELYDLAQDPKELSSIAEARPQVRTAMRGALDAMIAGTSVAAPSAVSEEDRQKLAALGYVGTQTGSALQRESDQLPDPKAKIGVLKTYRQAQRLAAEQQYSQASALYRQILADNPDMTDAWLQLAEAHNRLGQANEALAAYKEVISRDPKNAAALTGATSTLLRAGRIEEAKAHAELALDVSPAIAHETLARIAVYQQRPDDARRHARLAQAADPSLPMVAFIEGMLLHGQGRFAEASQQLSEARRAMASRTEQLPDLNYLAGDSLARLERYQEAEELFRAELKVFPLHIRARAGLAMLFKATGRDAEAARMVTDIVRLTPTDEGLDTAAQLWTMFGEPDRAAAVRRMRGQRR